MTSSFKQLHESQQGFLFEMVTTKLQSLEYHMIEKDLQLEDKIIALTSAIENLSKSVEKMTWVVQQNGDTTNYLAFNGKFIAQNLTALQRDVREVLAGQQMLVTRQQFGHFMLLRGVNASLSSVARASKYTSCAMLPFRASGVYSIQPETPFKEPMTVLCDQEYDSGGWVVIQHRFDGSTNFYRNWKEYKTGFGQLEGEFWLGLDRIHQLTTAKPHELVMLLEDFDGNSTYARYDLFEIGGESQMYELTKIAGYAGTAGDSLSDLKGMKFSSFDADNDVWEKNCAVEYTGAWWYNNCHKSNLNGQYLKGETTEFAKGMVWQTFRGYHYALKSAKMMIRSNVKYISKNIDG
ncbi:ficolin-2-like [Anopheles bellator]|uniref:ficolin-2-like n=1 Tax=Anopheles bellator TaxID=139047 RepID=UPI00264753B8|nr:ficolin-2-like [Anopheles bellator]